MDLEEEAQTQDCCREASTWVHTELWLWHRGLLVRDSWWVLPSLFDWFNKHSPGPPPCVAPAPLRQSTECMQLEDGGHTRHIHLLSLVASPALNPAEALRVKWHAKWHTEMSKKYYITASCLPTCSKMWMVLNAIPSPQGVIHNEPQGVGCCYTAQCELTEHLPGKTGKSWESEKYPKWA